MGRSSKLGKINLQEVSTLLGHIFRRQVHQLPNGGDDSLSLLKAQEPLLFVVEREVPIYPLTVR